MNDSQLHSGHRERMIERFTSYPDSLNDHEILEILLYSLVPRIDTNPLAHRLLRVFGSLDAIFNANVSELMTVPGVGHKIAIGITLIGNVFNRTKTQNKEKIKETWLNSEVIEANLRKIVTNFDTEQFVMVLLDGKCVKLSHLEFEDKNKYSVTMDVPEVMSAFAVHKPKLAIVAHTHPSGSLSASPQDDFTTYKLNLFCEIHGVRLVEHMILTRDGKFSYATSGNMERVRTISDLGLLLKQIEENKNEQS